MRASPPPRPFRPRPLVGPRALVNIYRRRLRVQAVQELLAGLGIAVAVALVFATLVANSSIAGSAGAVLRGIVGPAKLQLRARGPEGFSESVLKHVESLSAVKQAAPVLEQSAVLHSPHGHTASLLIVGGDIALTTLDGLAHTLPASTLEPGAIALTREAAEQAHLPATSRDAAGTRVVLDVAGRAVPLKIGAVLGSEAIGAVSQSRVAVMPLEELQQIALLPHRVSRIFVEPKPGQGRLARTQLEAVSRGRISVAPADQDLRQLQAVLRPEEQASAMFALIATLLGFLFAFNAMLLTAPQRRQAIADFRLGGARRTVIVEMVLFQALCLGVLAAALGALGGYALLRTAFHQRPGYLSHAFTLGGGTVIGVGPLLLAIAAGLVAICLAACIPLLDLRRGRALDAVYFEDGEPGNWVDGAAVGRLAVVAGVLLALASLLFVLAPSLAVPAAGLLAVASVLAVPSVLATALRAAGVLVARYERLTALSVALRSLRATTLRSLALVATGVVALFGAVALGGARADLMRGMHTQAADGAVGGQLHVTNPGDTEEVTSFQATTVAAKIARVPGVAAVRASHGQFVPLDGRLIAIFAHPLESTSSVARDEIESGCTRCALQGLRRGSAVTVSGRLASELHVRAGRALSLPTPTGTARLHVAAITTNLGWPGGAVLMNPAQFARLWATSADSGLTVSLKPSVSVSRAQRAIIAALGPHSGLEVLRAGVWSERFFADVKEGLQQLGEITAMLTLAAILALGAALVAMIWQRRKSLSGLRLSGVPPRRLRHILLAEATLLLGTGALIGMVSGIYGQAIIDGYIKRYAGFPLTPFGSGAWALEILVAVVAIALALACVPGITASRVSPTLALADE